MEGLLREAHAGVSRQRSTRSCFASYQSCEVRFRLSHTHARKREDTTSGYHKTAARTVSARRGADGSARAPVARALARPCPATPRATLRRVAGGE